MQKAKAKAKAKAHRFSLPMKCKSTSASEKYTRRQNKAVDFPRDDTLCSGSASIRETQKKLQLDLAKTN